MYFARFELGNTSVGVAALTVGRATPTLLPPPWVDRLLAARDCAFAVRLVANGPAPATTLLVSSEHDDELEALCRELLGTVPPAEGATAAGDVATFDRLVSPPPCQLWLNHGGYQANGRPLATDFRLFPQIEPLARRTGGLVYQCCFAAHRPEREFERVARKFLAALRVESPFPPAVTELQSTLASRLLQGGFLSDELMGFESAAGLAIAASAIEESFQGTMGHFGFVGSPVESGDFQELFVTGLHSTRFAPDSHFITRAASIMSADETRQFLQLRTSGDGGKATVSDGVAGVPSIFLSYSSSDFTQAWATCQFLERHGLYCWIAPRNILPGEPYPEAIMRGLNDARALVVLVSGASNLSPHVHREIERALHNHAVIIPMRVQDVIPTGTMEYLLSTCQWLDAFAAFEQSLDELRGRLRGLLGL